MNPTWTDNRRRDGLLVMQTFECNWVVLPHDDSPAIDLCPCCDRPMLTPTAAQLVADAVYPLREQLAAT